MPSILGRFLVALSLVAVAASAQSPTLALSDRSSDRFRLYDECQPMVLLITAPDKAKESGITEARLQVAAESRLRAAGLYGGRSEHHFEPVLHLLVHVQKLTFVVEVRYMKPVTDQYGLSQIATTWSSGDYGSHGGSGSTYIMASVYENLDEFLAAYLRVNEQACKQAGRRR